MDFEILSAWLMFLLPSQFFILKNFKPLEKPEDRACLYPHTAHPHSPIFSSAHLSWNTAENKSGSSGVHTEQYFCHCLCFECKPSKGARRFKVFRDFVLSTHIELVIHKTLKAFFYVQISFVIFFCIVEQFVLRLLIALATQY